ncbi:MAG: TlpA family protein disulfide reductase [Pedobacter sp.]|nr:MAG: TlpA family protein disulfide reductase [Pedobacter sp.]
MKIIKETLSSLLLAAGICVTSYAQQKEVVIGNKLPETLIQVQYGSEKKTINLKDLYKDKLLIIDFWATWCVPCLKEMKFLDSLRFKHPEELNVLMVTRESNSIISEFFSQARNRDITSKNLMISVSDTVLHKLFPHRGIPHNVWIDKTGTVRAITSQTAVTIKNILGFQHGEKPSGMRMKKEVAFDPAAERFSAGDTSFTYRSIITRKIPGIYSGGSFTVPEGEGTKRHFIWNGFLLRAFWNAYSEFNPHLRLNLIEIHTRDSLKFIPPSREYARLLKGSKYADYDAWKDDHAVFYDLNLRKGVPNSKFRDFMFNDLEREFNVEAKIEKRPVKCVVITKKGKIRNAEQGNPLERTEISRKIGFKISIRNATIADFAHFMFRDFPKTSDVVPNPLVIENITDSTTRFNAELDFTNDVDPINQMITPEMVYNKLKKFGYRFKEEMRQYPILVLYDRD